MQTCDRSALLVAIDYRDTMVCALDARGPSIFVQSESTSTVNLVPDSESLSTSPLPPEVPDIDAGDDDKHLFCTEYVKDICNYMFSLEAKWLIKQSFLSLQVEVNPSIRALNIDWLIRIHQVMKLLPETLFLAVSLVDHYLQIRIADVKKMKVLCVAALYTAAKYEEQKDIFFDHCHVETIADMTDINAGEVRNMEKDILRAVDWSLTRPLSLHFLRRNCKAAKASKVEELTAMYILEVCLLDYNIAGLKPSMQAAAALWCALQLLGRPKDCWDQKMQFYSRHSPVDLRWSVRNMAKLTLDAPEGENTAPYEKYRSSWYENVGCVSKTKACKLRLMTRPIRKCSTVPSTRPEILNCVKFP